MQLGFYFDQSRCTGCYTCCVACKDWHDIPAGPAKWMRIQTIERGKFPNLFMAFLATPCYHCAEPVCISVCPAGAITKREEDGVVVVDRDKCKEAVRCGIISDKLTKVPFEERAAPCTLACPAHISVPGSLALIANGRYKEALNLIREQVPIPGVLGHVCKCPCEDMCARKDVEEPIAINALKRFVSDYVVDDKPTPITRTKEEKVAIVGSGPAGLAAAYDLLRMGYGVTIFEALPVAGGMLAVGIPGYHLPKEVLQREIDYIKGLGVEIKTNTPIGDGLSLDDLSRQGYKATFIAIGAHQGRKLPVPGADLDGVLIGTSFLRDINLGHEVKVGERVLVLGGGDVAIDCARSASRLGAKQVQLACLESREEMPADISQVKTAEEEGVVICPSLTFTKCLNNGGKVAGVECLRIRSVKFDESGEPHIDVIPGSEHTVTADTVIWAIGQAPEVGFLSGASGIKVSKRGTIVVDPETLETQRPGVFAGGDAIGGKASVIDAIAYGKKAAVYIDRYLKGEVVSGGRQVSEVQASDIKVVIPPDIERAKRQSMPELSLAERSGNFKEVPLGYNEEQAIAEAKRCLNCAGNLCKEVCPYGAPQFEAEENSKMQLCNFCLDRWAENKKPICVASCPVRAMDAGPIEELKAKYGDIQEAEGFIYSPENKPSIVFKPKVKPTSG